MSQLVHVKSTEYGTPGSLHSLTRQDSHIKIFWANKGTMSMILKISKHKYENCTFQIVQLVLVDNAIILLLFLYEDQTFNLRLIVVFLLHLLNHHRRYIDVDNILITIIYHVFISIYLENGRKKVDKETYTYWHSIKWGSCKTNWIEVAISPTYINLSRKLQWTV